MCGFSTSILIIALISRSPSSQLMSQMEKGVGSTIMPGVEMFYWVCWWKSFGGPTGLFPRKGLTGRSSHCCSTELPQLFAQELALSAVNTEIEHRSETSQGFCLKTLPSSVYNNNMGRWAGVSQQRSEGGFNPQVSVLNGSKFLLSGRPGALSEVLSLLTSGMALEWGELQVCVSPPGRWNKS